MTDVKTKKCSYCHEQKTLNNFNCKNSSVCQTCEREDNDLFHQDFDHELDDYFDKCVDEENSSLLEIENTEFDC